MAKSAIGVGSAANDGTGDDLRSGAIKINANFDEIYGALGTGTALSTGISATASAVTLTAPTINGAIGGTATSQTISALTTAGITGTGGALEITAANYITEFRGDGTNSGTVGTIQLNCSANSHGQKIQAQPHSANVTNTLTLPAGADSTLVSLVSADTLENKILTAPDINNPDIDGGAIDGATIGGATPAAVTGTTITSTTTFQLKTYADTTARDNAITSPASGMLIYLTATNKAQVYANNAWVDLH